LKIRGGLEPYSLYFAGKIMGRGPDAVGCVFRGRRGFLINRHALLLKKHMGGWR